MRVCVYMHALESLQQYTRGNQPHKKETIGNHNEKKLKLFTGRFVMKHAKYLHVHIAAISTCRITTPT